MFPAIRRGDEWKSFSMPGTKVPPTLLTKMKPRFQASQLRWNFRAPTCINPARPGASRSKLGATGQKIKVNDWNIDRWAKPVRQL